METLNETKTKICSKCKEEKPVSEFYASKRRKDGLQNNCRGCNKAIVSSWQNEHREEINAKIDTEKRKADLKEWYANNKEKHKENVMNYNKEQYTNDPFYRLTKDIYHLVYRYSK